MATCPECGESVSLRPLWARAKTDRVGLLVEPTGIQCPTCRVRLEIRQARSGLVLGTAWVGGLAWAFLLATVAKGNVWLALLGVAPLLLLPWLGNWIAASAAALSSLPKGKRVEFPLDVLWVCIRCGCDNPSAQDLCVNCDKERVL
jgi:hypothetical protein